MSVKRIGIALILIGFLGTNGWFAPEPVHACSCMRPDFEVALESSSEVFIGSVVAIEEVYDPHESPGTIGRRNAVLFEVERSYKHMVPSQMIVYAGYGGGSCGYDFAMGQQYLVYGYTMYENELHTWLCSRTQPTDATGDDLAKLGEGLIPLEKVNLESELEQTWLDTVQYHAERIIKIWALPEAIVLSIIAMSLLFIVLGLGYYLRASKVLDRLIQWVGGFAAIAAISSSLIIMFFNPFVAKLSTTEVILIISMMLLPACLALLSVWHKSALWMFIAFLLALPLGLFIVSGGSAYSIATIPVFLYFVCGVWMLMVKRVQRLKIEGTE